MLRCGISVAMVRGGRDLDEKWRWEGVGGMQWREECERWIGSVRGRQA